MDGWIKIHRKLLNWEWYDDINVKVVFLHLLLTANHRDQKWRGKIIMRGQKLTSVQHLADETKLSVQQTRTALNKLKSTNEITVKSTSKYTLITIEKYGDYQNRLEEDNKQNNEQNNKQITNEQQTNNKQITTNKKEKKEKNNKNEKEIEKDVAEIIKCYEENIGLLTPATSELLFDYLKDMDKDLIIKAIKIASINNKRTCRYIQGILNDWNKKGFKSLLEVEQEEQNFSKNNKMKKNKSNNRGYEDSFFDNIYAN